MDIYAIGFEASRIVLCKIVRKGDVLMWEYALYDRTPEDLAMFDRMADQLGNGWYSYTRSGGEGDGEAAAKIARLMGLPFIGEMEREMKPYCEGDL